MPDRRIKSVIIVGGGTAGWMSAAALSSALSKQDLSITLIESAAIGTVGVGEATLPHIRFFNQKLGIDEQVLMRETQATFKLGIEFCDWGAIGQSYIHPFGNFGLPINRTPFHHYVTRNYGKMSHQMGQSASLDEFSLPVMAARAGKFQLPHSDPDNILSTFGYAYQFDAGLYAAFLRRFSQAKGVVRREGLIVNAKVNSETGFIETVQMETGEDLAADLFIDCSGFRGLLIEQVLKAGYQDWTDYLPCNRAVTVGTENIAPPLPYTRATAKAAGWQWRIPLQHRTGNGYVYCNDFISDDEAAASLTSDIEGQALGEPKTLRFVTGQRKTGWIGNCVAIGLSGGFLEPLESTGIYLIQEAITTLTEFFPTRDCPDTDRNEYNRLMDLAFERVRDFLILHYVATGRDDSEFWNHCRNMPIPESLQYKMDLFKASGQVVSYETGAFKIPSWLAVYYGQGIVPNGYHPMADHMPDDMLATQIFQISQSVEGAVGSMADHAAFIDQYCRVPV